MFTAALLTKAKAWKQPKCPSTDERLRVWHAQTMEYYSAMKKNETKPFAATWMDLEMSTRSKGRQRKTRIISLTCGVKFKKKNYTKKLIYRTGTDSQTQKTRIQVISELHTWPSAGRGGDWDSSPDLMLSQTPKQQEPQEPTAQTLINF